MQVFNKIVAPSGGNEEMAGCLQHTTINPERKRTRRDSVANVGLPAEPKLSKRELLYLECFNRGYKILQRCVGVGAYARVHVAEILPHKLSSDLGLREACIKNKTTQVVIKMVDKQVTPTVFVEKFLPRELENHTKLPAHNHVVRCFEVFTSVHYVYIVLEYCRHGDLLDHINKHIDKDGRGMSEANARMFFIQICRGVQHCHDNRIVHRDIKCENVLLCGNNLVKITDFGFSCRLRDKAALLSTSCGSFAYAAPEVISCKPYDGQLADVWSLGIVLYAMLNGRLPYSEKRLSEMENEMKMQTFDLDSNISMECQRLIRRTLQFGPERRPTLQEVLTDEWLNVYGSPARKPIATAWENTHGDIAAKDNSSVVVMQAFSKGPLASVPPNTPRVLSSSTRAVSPNKATELPVAKCSVSSYRDLPPRPATWTQPGGSTAGTKSDMPTRSASTGPTRQAGQGQSARGLTKMPLPDATILARFLTVDQERERLLRAKDRVTSASDPSTYRYTPMWFIQRAKRRQREQNNNSGGVILVPDYWRQSPRAHYRPPATDHLQKMARYRLASRHKSAGDGAQRLNGIVADEKKRAKSAQEIRANSPASYKCHPTESPVVKYSGNTELSLVIKHIQPADAACQHRSKLPVKSVRQNIPQTPMLTTHPINQQIKQSTNPNHQIRLHPQSLVTPTCAAAVPGVCIQGTGNCPQQVNRPIMRRPVIQLGGR